ncbi:DEAD/DEAH box helicase [Mariniblastus sp.]|nr:DEAD/DEAH box helicase [Mariniblastus sp.]
MTSKPENKLTLKDRLSRLTYLQATKLLGDDGKKLLQLGGAYEIDIAQQVYFRGDLFQVKLPAYGDKASPVVSIMMLAEAKKRLKFDCTHCNGPCEHVGAAFGLILEEKMALGLSKPPKERKPLESLSEEELVAQAIADRKERAKTEKFKLTSNQPKKAWGDYTLTSKASGKSYHLSVFGTKRGESYCSCPDFRKNTLGTCKHLLHAVNRIKTKFPSSKRQTYKPKHFSLQLAFESDADGASSGQISLRLTPPSNLEPEADKIAGKLLNRNSNNVSKLIRTITKLERADYRVHIRPDAAEYIDQRLHQQRIEDLVKEIRTDPTKHPLRTSLLKTELLPYQMDGVAFAAGAGRAILADDMGLGKTIQGIGVAELLAQEAGLKKVLVICPTSLKSQWAAEIAKFCDRDSQLILGSAYERADQYHNDAFFTICNYEQVLRDHQYIEPVPWDLIILDEGQRIKNWEAKTSNVVKSLQSKYALVLSGTPLENRLGELFSVVQFVDDRRLGPGFRFFNRHRVVDESGKVLGYKNLAELRKTLAPIMLRRTRDDVLTELPPRTTEIVRITPTDEQKRLNDANIQIVASIVGKSYFTEMDFLRLQRALLAARMAADSTFLNTKKEPSYSSKLERLDELLQQLFAHPKRKVVLFSEWTTMLGLIEKILQRQGLSYVRLDGSVPQKKRKMLVDEFQNDPDCKLFITTNAGSTGLNLQAANTVINVDLPWNPAILEQRIARAHRMGQKDPVQVYLLVTQDTFEEQLLVTLDDKRNLALAALDSDSDVDEIQMTSGFEEMKRRLEVLIGSRADAPLDESLKTDALAASQSFAAQREHQERVASAGGEMLGAVFNFLGQLVQQSPTHAQSRPDDKVIQQVAAGLTNCVQKDETGRSRLTVTLPDDQSLTNLATTLATLLVGAEKSE